MSVRNREEAVVARLQSLAMQLDGEPDPAFRAATRARLVAMAAVRTPASPARSPLRRFLTEGTPSPSRWRTRLTAGLAAAALTVTALASVVAVAADARPGDVLYDLKRGTEETQLALAGDARGETLLELAATRLDEVRSLVDDGVTALPAAGSSRMGGSVLAAGADAALVVATLGTMDAQTTQGAAWLTDRALLIESTRPLETLSGWAAAQSAGLAGLQDRVPAAATGDVARSLVLLADIVTRVSGLAPALACTAGPAVAGADALGPVPAPCLPEATTAPAPESSGGSGSVGLPAVPSRGEAAVPPVPEPALPADAGMVPGAPGSDGGDVPTPASPPLARTDVPVPALPPPPPPTLPPPPPPALPPTPLVPRLPASAADPAPTATPPEEPDVCLGPIAIGTC